MAAGAHAVSHFDENDAETLRLAIASIAPDVLFYAGMDNLPHVDAVIDGLAARGKSPAGRLPILVLISGTTATMDKAHGVFVEGETKIWNDLSVEDIKSLPSDAPYHYEKHQRVFRADAARRIDGYIICPPAICGVASGPVRQSSVFFEIILDNCKALGGRVGQVGPGTNVSEEIHIDDVTDFALFLTKHALSGPAAVSPYEKFFFVSTGTFQWKDFNAAVARVLYSKGVIPTPEIMQMTAEEALTARRYFFVTIGNQAVKAERALSLGWKPKKPQFLFPHLEEGLTAALALRGGVL